MPFNLFNSYIHLEDYIAWIELFGLNTLDVLSQKRIIAAVSGAILPVVALGFIKSLIDYIKPTKENITPITDAVDKVKQLTGYTYNYKTALPTDRTGGIMAQDLEKVLPDAVVEDENGTKYVKYDAVIGLLVSAGSELSQKLETV